MITVIYRLGVRAIRPSSSQRLAWLWLVGTAGLAIAGCRPDGATPPIDPVVARIRAEHEQHKQLYGDFDIPRKIGMVENVGLQLPMISPDGRRMLYLRTDCESLSPMTLLGSADPQDTPPERTLSIWLRSVAGTGDGEQLSRCRWAHSPIWSDSGAVVACVANNPPRSDIVHIDMANGKTTILGLRGAVNCLPRFDGDDRTLLFCSGKQAAGPFRIYRQAIDEAAPVPLSPDGADCLFPVGSDKAGHVLCARTDAEYLHWVRCNVNGMTDLAPRSGLAGRPLLLQTWAGVASPLSADRGALLFFDTSQARIGVLDTIERVPRPRHRPGSIAACWAEGDSIALATGEAAFIVNTRTGVSATLFSGAWIPCRYVPESRRLILLGQDHPGRFSIWEVVFKGSCSGTT